MSFFLSYTKLATTCFTVAFCVCASQLQASAAGNDSATSIDTTLNKYEMSVFGKTFASNSPESRLEKLEKSLRIKSEGFAVPQRLDTIFMQLQQREPVNESTVVEKVDMHKWCISAEQKESFNRCYRKFYKTLKHEVTSTSSFNFSEGTVPPLPTSRFSVSTKINPDGSITDPQLHADFTFDKENRFNKQSVQILTQALKAAAPYPIPPRGSALAVGWQGILSPKNEQGPEKKAGTSPIPTGPDKRGFARWKKDKNFDGRQFIWPIGYLQVYYLENGEWKTLLHDYQFDEGFDFPKW